MCMSEMDLSWKISDFYWGIRWIVGLVQKINRKVRGEYRGIKSNTFY